MLQPNLLKDVGTSMVPLTACCVRSPPNHGQVPAARFRHSAVHVTARQGSSLHRSIAEGLSSIPDSRASFLQERGHLVLLFGGYDTQGREFGGPDLEVGCSSSRPFKAAVSAGHMWKYELSS